MRLMTTTLLILAAITFVSTVAGGLVAVRFRRILQYFFAFSSGALIGITFFDVLPESLSIAGSVGLSVRWVMITLVASFIFFSFLQRFFLTHHHHEDEEHGHIMGPVGASGLIVHSFLDGAAIGIAFHVSSSMGIIVALAVISHDFTDGINTVVIMLKNQQNVRNARTFLFMDAAAPVVGILTTAFFAINETVLALILAVFAGEFLYLGAANLLPETYLHNVWQMGVVMIFGVLFIFVLTSIILSL
jgi:zinc transporter ZupT